MILKGIKDETDMNELEIVTFGIEDNTFGINVMNVREIINPVPITQVPQVNSHVQGIIELRGDVLPVIDIAKTIGFPPSKTPKQAKFIVTEFNQQKIVCHVHSVSNIHRISQEQIEKPSIIDQEAKSQIIIGVAKLKNELVFLLDFEKIVIDTYPETEVLIRQISQP